MLSLHLSQDATAIYGSLITKLTPIISRGAALEPAPTCPSPTWMDYPPWICIVFTILWTPSQSSLALFYPQKSTKPQTADHIQYSAEGEILAGFTETTLLCLYASLYLYFFILYI